MTVATFITLLAFFAVVTSICTEGVKKVLNDIGIKYPSNVVVLIIACVVGIGGTGVFYVLSGIAFTLANVVCMGLMGIATAMGAMVGYDKVIQAIEQMAIFNNKSGL